MDLIPWAQGALSYVDADLLIFPNSLCKMGASQCYKDIPRGNKLARYDNKGFRTASGCLQITFEY